MTESLFSADRATEYATKEVGGVLIIALGFVFALGGVTAAAIFMCGWDNVKSVSVNWQNGTASIVCR